MFEETIYVLAEVGKSINSAMGNRSRGFIRNILFMSKDQGSSFTQEEFGESRETFREFIKFFRDLIIILIIVIFIRVFIMTPFRINGSSMEESYHDKEYILVDKFSYLNFEETFAKMSGSGWVEKSIRTVS